MHILLLSNEYPPNVYGGAGVHIDNLSRAMAGLDEGRHQIDVLAFGEQELQRDNLRVRGVPAGQELPRQDPRHGKLLSALQRNLAMTGLAEAPDVIHCHTWYSHFAGLLLQQLTGAPLVLTTHSLEPQRPWKAEQLGRAYNVTTWLEGTAYGQADGVIAVSGAMGEDVQRLYGVAAERVQVIHNGIDPDVYKPKQAPQRLRAYGVDPERPTVLFVGRISRQKGLTHLLDAVPAVRPEAQIVLCAGAPDTPELAEQVRSRVQALQKSHDLIWVQEMVPQPDLIALYTQARVFVCPSVYEPFGLINLEAAACETAVVASAVGGIPEVVADGDTGYLVPLSARGPDEAGPADPDAFAAGLASKINALLDDPDLADQMGKAGRARVLEKFTWQAIARKTLDYYRMLAKPEPTPSV